MNKLQRRLKKRFKMIAENWRSDVCFSKKLAWMRLVADIGGRIGLKKLSLRLNTKKEDWILQYLSTELNSIFQKYKNCEKEGSFIENAPIWVCWWTGIDTAPALVQQCIRSVYKHSGTHPVNLITKDTYKEYIYIPSYIYEKLISKKMKVAHFADYVRVCLLERYGGLWIDATIYCSNRIPESCFSLPVYTCKSELKTGYYISNFQWTTFCLGGWKNNLFYIVLKELFEKYWKNHETAIDYLFFDDFIYLAKERVPAIKLYLDNVPVNNIHRDDLQNAMNIALPEDRFATVLSEETFFYKLSWREHYSEENNGKKTIFAYFLGLDI